MRIRIPASLCCVAIVVAGCATKPDVVPPIQETPLPVEAAALPDSTRGKFTIEADKLDTWNAVGQILVRTPGVTYEGRAQMLDLYSVSYRGRSFLIFTRALPLSGTTRRTTTEVTATTPQGKPVDSDAVAELLTQLQLELPAEIESVRARQAAAKKAKERKSKAKKK